MSVRKRTWTKSNGEVKTAWVVDYVDQAGKRRLNTFAKKKDADGHAAKFRVEVTEGVHVPDSATVTVAEASEKWIESGLAAGLERTSIDQRQLHLDRHIKPFLGRIKLSKITVPTIRSFRDRLRTEGRSPAMIKRATTSLGSILTDAQEQGLVVRSAVYEQSRSQSRRRANRHEQRHKAPLQIGGRYPNELRNQGDNRGG